MRNILKNRNPVIIVLLVIIAFWIYSVVSRQYYLSKHNFTICKVYEESIENTSVFAKYKYVVNNKVFYNKISVENTIKNKFFKLKYSIKKPSICKFIFDKEITDSVAIAKFKADMLRSKELEIEAIRTKQLKK